MLLLNIGWTSRWIMVLFMPTQECFPPGFVVSRGRGFLFRAAWTLQTPQVQHKGFDPRSLLGAYSQLRKIWGASQVLLTATTLTDQPSQGS